MSTPLSIAFSHEELVVLAELGEMQLPLLGDRPLAGLTGSARDAVLDSATRSLLARGVLVRDGDHVGIVHAAAGLLAIASASSLRAEVIVDDGAGRSWHTVYAVPYAAVDTSIDENGNHRFEPFATVDLLVHLARLTGLVPEGEAPTIDAPAPDGAGTSTLPFGHWAAARAAVRRGDRDDATTVLVDGGVSEANAVTLVGVLESGSRTVAVQIIHHPSATTSAGGEVAWVDAGGYGRWLVPTVDQPFGRLPRPDGIDDVRTLARATAGESGDPTLTEVDATVVTVGPITAEQLLRDLHDVMPRPG